MDHSDSGEPAGAKRGTHEDQESFTHRRRINRLLTAVHLTPSGSSAYSAREGELSAALDELGWLNVKRVASRHKLNHDDAKEVVQNAWVYLIVRLRRAPMHSLSMSYFDRVIRSIKRALGRKGEIQICDWDAFIALAIEQVESCVDRFITLWEMPENVANDEARSWLGEQALTDDERLECINATQKKDRKFLADRCPKSAAGLSWAEKIACEMAIEGFAQAAIADKLGLSTTWVNNQLRSARQKLVAYLGLPDLLVGRRQNVVQIPPEGPASLADLSPHNNDGPKRDAQVWECQNVIRHAVFHDRPKVLAILIRYALGDAPPKIMQELKMDPEQFDSEMDGIHDMIVQTANSRQALKHLSSDRDLSQLIEDAGCDAGRLLHCLSELGLLLKAMAGRTTRRKKSNGADAEGQL